LENSTDCVNPKKGNSRTNNESNQVIEYFAAIFADLLSGALPEYIIRIDSQNEICEIF
jgi:hypothetical protein